MGKGTDPGDNPSGRVQIADGGGAVQLVPGYNNMAAHTPVMKGGAPVPGWGHPSNGGGQPQSPSRSNEGARGAKDTNGNTGSRGKRGE